ncbi:MAG: dihydrolipoyl dehydrogenase [Bacteroidetes bacterium]|nr:dihydrolipoyl dehydrogenase [Bacteroidota bacterium]
MNSFQVVVIGSGPGGYVAAIRCAQLGFKTALIEKYNTLGGTCLNVGCIPSKALLDSSEHYYNAAHSFAEHGIELSNLKVNFAQMIARKTEVVSQTCAGVSGLMKKNGVEVFRGLGSFNGKGRINVTEEDGSKIELSYKKAIVATGSKPSGLPGIEPDKKRIITSTEALNLKEIPSHLLVIGGGVIGLEMGSVYARLGSKVSIVEFADRLIPGFDSAMSKDLTRVMKKLGAEVFTETRVTSVKNMGKQVVVTAENNKGESFEWKVPYCLVSVGRKPFTEGLNLDSVGISIDERGRIPVNEHLQTADPTIYAIGDVVRGAMLAHKAEEEGMLAAEIIAGQQPHINYLLIPNVVYTWPEVASVGHTEEELKALGRAYKVGSFPFRASGRARASMDLDGQVKVLADKENDEILGVHIIGPRAADMIAEAVVAMEYRATAEDIARMSHAHPTYTESFREACLAATENRAIHI